jgi:hypothetical protein
MSAKTLTESVARWITPEFETVAHIVEETLREEAWWAAARSGKYACSKLVWADEIRSVPAETQSKGCCDECEEVVDDLTL